MRDINEIINFKSLRNRYFLPKYLREMKKLRIGGLSGGNSLNVITDGDVCFSSIISSIKSSKKSINLETYIFNSDNVGWMIAEELAKASNRGVEVNLIYDSVGSVQTKSKLFDFMKSAGIDIIEFHPILNLRKIFKINLRDHRKIMVIDGKTAFIGGMNIGKEYAGKKYNGDDWRDTHVKIEGPAVKDIQYFFMENFIRSGGLISDFASYFPELEKKDGKLIMILSSKTKKNIKPIKESYLSAIRNAKEYIYITNAYFVPDAKIYRALINSAMKGVEVCLILPRKTDIPIVRYAGMYLYKRFLKHGVKIYEYDHSVLHAKTAVIDGIWSTIGSANLDRRSVNYNLEINAVVLDQEFGNKMKSIFNKDLKKTKQLTLDHYERRSIIQFLIEWLSYRFRKLL
ncbi:MAG: cardiolipin synthase [Spirochaetes bacterium]|nr:cardiolipin synthase [Spirochaetota bacterium]